jgi:fatty acid metabolism transcriptional regulator FadR
MIKPINAQSLKDLFIKQFEEHILSGYFKAGEKLPSERDLATQMGVSRPVVHEGLVDLAAKGLVTMRPRHGALVNDYRKEGSLAILQTILTYDQGNVADELLSSVLDMRLLFEVENAKLAALNRTDAQIAELTDILAQENTTPSDAIGTNTKLDFSFHHCIAMASGNAIYPLILNSMKSFYTNLSGLFFKDPDIIPTVRGFHKDLTEAIDQKNPTVATRIMTTMLQHGESHLRKLMVSTDTAISKGA